MKIDIEGHDLLKAVKEQRDQQADAAANNAAAIQVLLRRIAELESELPEKKAED